jgi:hypothetical protein
VAVKLCVSVVVELQRRAEFSNNSPPMTAALTIAMFAVLRQFHSVRFSKLLFFVDQVQPPHPLSPSHPSPSNPPPRALLPPSSAMSTTPKWAAGTSHSP